MITRCGLLAMALVANGCGGRARLSVSDQAAMSHANRFHRALTPSLVPAEGRFQAYLQQIANRLESAANELSKQRGGPLARLRAQNEWAFGDIRVNLLASPTPNAFTTGGDLVYVFSGLLQRCPSEDELAAMIGHEFGHVLAGHATAVMKGLAEDASAPNTVVHFIEGRFSPAMEQQADELGFLVYCRAGWDPGRFISMMEQAGARPERVSAVRALAEQLPPVAQEWARAPIADERRFMEYRQAALAEAGARMFAEPSSRLANALPNCFTAEDLAEQRLAQRELMSPPAGADGMGSDAPPPFEKGLRQR